MTFHGRHSCVVFVVTSHSWCVRCQQCARSRILRQLQERQDASTKAAARFARKSDGSLDLLGEVNAECAFAGVDGLKFQCVALA